MPRFSNVAVNAQQYSQRQSATSKNTAICGFVSGPGKGGTLGSLRPSPSSETCLSLRKEFAKQSPARVLSQNRSLPSLWRLGGGWGGGVREKQMRSGSKVTLFRA